ncbi:MAG: MMPL family transporter [candidate division WOR-3 bacterium]|nr:MMPL family transporter [candidate division WOR-3 bacterium]
MTIKRALWVVGVVGLVVVVAGVLVRGIKINANLSAYLPKNDSLVWLFNYIGEKYRGNYLAIVAIESEDIFSKEVIEKINVITQGLKSIEGVAGVLSLTNITDIKKTSQGIEVGNIVDENQLPQTDSALLEFRNYVLSKELYRGHIVAPDTRATLIIVRLWEDIDQTKVTDKIKKVVKENLPPGKVYFVGLPFQIAEINRLIRQDLILLIPIVTIVIAVVLYLNFGTAIGVFITLITIGAGVVINMGLMSLFKVKLTIISNIIPVILFTVGSAYCIHVLSKLSEVTKIQDAFQSLKGIIKPVTLSALTTAIGFSAFIFGSYLPIIREFGIFSAVGTLVICLLSLSLTPALWILWGKNHITLRNTTKACSMKIWRKSFQFILKCKWLVFIITAIISVLGAFYIPRIIRTSDFISYFKPHTEIRIADQFMNQTFGGSIPIQILIKGDILTPEALLKIKELTDSLNTIPGISQPQSIVDLIKEASYAIGEQKEIPDSKEKITNLWFLLEGEELTGQLVNHSADEAILTAMVSGINTRHRKTTITKIQNFIKQLKTENIDFVLTGSPLIYDRLDRSLTKSQILSIGIAIVLLSIVLLLLTGSLLKGLLGILPIFLTLVILLGFMGLAKIPLDVATVLVGSISLGVGIDYAIHFLSRLEKELNNKNSPYDAIIKTAESTGWAILVNVVSVTLGFLVLIFAELIPLVRFGILLAITMLCSGIGSLTILPITILNIYQNRR